MKEGLINPLSRRVRWRTVVASWMAWLFDRHRGALVFICKTAAFALLAGVAELALIGLFKTRVLHETLPTDGSIAIVPMLIGAPLIENLLFIAAAEAMLASNVRTSRIVISIAICASAIHAVDGLRGIVVGFNLFATMSYSYVLWRDVRFAKRYFITVMQHMLFNAPAVWLLGDSFFD
jgi:hypothetical protein